MILRQSLVNMIITYLGFALGAVNYMVLYLRFMSAEYFGLVGVVLSTAALLMPLMSFGIPNTLVKFYSGLQDEADRQRFLTWCLVLPLAILLPLAVFSIFANEAIGAFMARKNAIVGDYVWHIFLIGLAMAYFEVFFAWSKVCFKTVYGNFLKEMFARAGVTLLLALLYLKSIDEAGFLFWLVLLYLVRTLLMFAYSWKLLPVRLRFQKPPEFGLIVKYSALIILGGSVAVLLLEVDRFMINQYIEIEQVAYYSLAIFIATVIVVPWRAMNQITYPLTAQLMNDNDLGGLGRLYKSSSLNLLVVAGWIFLLLALNLDQIYALVPEAYRSGAAVVVIIGAVKLYDSFLSINTSILYNSRYYVSLLFMGLALAVLTVGFNMYFIPRYGLIGAAYATALAVLCYNTYKLVFVWVKFGLQPATRATLWLTLAGACTWLLISLLHFSWHPLLSIGAKGILITVCFIGLTWGLRLSPELNALAARYLVKKDPGKKDPPRGPDN